ncbi:MAG: GGDEF domain-containing protein [Terracidiphilus sp.]
MISLKKYLDMEALEPFKDEDSFDALNSQTAECFQALLSSIGRSASQVYPNLGVDLEESLKGLQCRLSVSPTFESLNVTEKQVEILLAEWGGRTSGYFKGKADEVKELLIALANAAECVGHKNQGHSRQFKDLTDRLERIADLDDLTEVRSSLINRVTELRNSVNQMALDSQELVAHLKAEVSIYETRLKAAEYQALRDELTRVANRRSVEERVHWNIENRQPFCVVMLDLNRFKHINDKYGHFVGDKMLKQFAKELQLNTRSGDLVGRWGGDEFVVVLGGDAISASSHIGRIRDWVFGKYTIELEDKKKPLEIWVDASIGVAEWRSGETIQQVIEKADTAMYVEKNRLRRAASSKLQP